MALLRHSGIYNTDIFFPRAVGRPNSQAKAVFRFAMLWYTGLASIQWPGDGDRTERMIWPFLFRAFTREAISKYCSTRAIGVFNCAAVDFPARRAGVHQSRNFESCCEPRGAKL